MSSAIIESTSACNTHACDAADVEHAYAEPCLHAVKGVGETGKTQDLGPHLSTVRTHRCVRNEGVRQFHAKCGIYQLVLIT